MSKFAIVSCVLLALAIAAGVYGVITDPVAVLCGFGGAYCAANLLANTLEFFARSRKERAPQVPAVLAGIVRLARGVRMFAGFRDGACPRAGLCLRARTQCLDSPGWRRSVRTAHAGDCRGSRAPCFRQRGACASRRGGGAGSSPDGYLGSSRGAELRRNVTTKQCS